MAELHRIFSVLVLAGILQEWNKYTWMIIKVIWHEIFKTEASHEMMSLGQTFGSTGV